MFTIACLSSDRLQIYSVRAKRSFKIAADYGKIVRRTILPCFRTIWKVFPETKGRIYGKREMFRQQKAAGYKGSSDGREKNSSAQVNKTLDVRRTSPLLYVSVCLAVYPGIFVAKAFGYGLRMPRLSQLLQRLDLGFERRFVQPVERKQQIGQ